MQEYDRHLGAVNTITFVDENRRIVSTSDDKSLRVWEWYVVSGFTLTINSVVSGTNERNLFFDFPGIFQLI